MSIKNYNWNSWPYLISVLLYVVHSLLFFQWILTVTCYSNYIDLKYDFSFTIFIIIKYIKPKCIIIVFY